MVFRLLCAVEKMTDLPSMNPVSVQIATVNCNLLLALCNLYCISKHSLFVEAPSVNGILATVVSCDEIISPVIRSTRNTFTISDLCAMVFRTTHLPLPNLEPELESGVIENWWKTRGKMSFLQTFCDSEGISFFNFLKNAPSFLFLVKWDAKSSFVSHRLVGWLSWLVLWNGCNHRRCWEDVWGTSTTEKRWVLQIVFYVITVQPRIYFYDVKSEKFRGNFEENTIQVS